MKLSTSILALGMAAVAPFASGQEVLSFNQSSGPITWDCGEQKDLSLLFKAPPGGVVISANVGFTELHGRYKKDLTKCAPVVVQEERATATCQIAGEDRSFSICSGGGNGVAVLSGTYRIDASAASEQRVEFASISHPAVEWGCGDHKDFSSQFKAPAGATIVFAEGSQFRIGGMYEAIFCDTPVINPSKTTVTLMCHAIGAKPEFHICPGGGHADSLIRGAYRIPEGQ